MKKGILPSLYQIYKWLVFIPLLGIFTLVFGGMAILLSFFVPKHASFVPGLLWCKALAYITPVRVKIEGRENIEKGRSYVVIANHQSYFDIVGMYGWLYLDMRFVMKKELKKVPFFGTAVARAGHVFVDRSDRQKAIESLNRSVNGLKKGASVIIYPEGSRSRTKEVKEFRKGAFRLAYNTKMPILPISVTGTRNIQPPDTWLLYPGTIRIKVHPPIEMEHIKEEEIEPVLDKARNTIVRGIQELERDAHGPNE